VRSLISASDQGMPELTGRHRKAPVVCGTRAFHVVLGPYGTMRREGGAAKGAAAY
jgi:hypothetical protein